MTTITGHAPVRQPFENALIACSGSASRNLKRIHCVLCLRLICDSGLEQNRPPTKMSKSDDRGDGDQRYICQTEHRAVVRHARRKQFPAQSTQPRSRCHADPLRGQPRRLAGDDGCFRLAGRWARDSARRSVTRQCRGRLASGPESVTLVIVVSGNAAGRA